MAVDLMDNRFRMAKFTKLLKFMCVIIVVAVVVTFSRSSSINGNSNSSSGSCSNNRSSRSSKSNYIFVTVIIPRQPIWPDKHSVRVSICHGYLT